MVVLRQPVLKKQLLKTSRSSFLQVGTLPPHTSLYVAKMLRSPEKFHIVLR